MIRKVEILIIQHAILRKLFSLFSEQICKMKELMTFEPPVFKLSKYYLDALIKNRS